jgi:hypothetical protein
MLDHYVRVTKWLRLTGKRIEPFQTQLTDGGHDNSSVRGGFTDGDAGCLLVDDGVVGGECGGERVPARLLIARGWPREALWIRPIASSENRHGSTRLRLHGLTFPPHGKSGHFISGNW